MNIPLLTFADFAERFEGTPQTESSFDSLPNYYTRLYYDYTPPETKRSIVKSVLIILFIALMAVGGYLIFHNLERIKKWLIVKLSEKQEDSKRLEVSEKP